MSEKSLPEIGFLIANSITGAAPFVMDTDNHTATFKGITASPAGATTGVGLNISHPENNLSLLVYGNTGSTPVLALANNQVNFLALDNDNELRLIPAGGTVSIGSSGGSGYLIVYGNATAGTLTVQESLTISGTSGASVNSLIVNNQLNVTGASGASAKQLNVTNAVNVSGASAGTLNAGTGTIAVSGASANSLDAGAGSITVSGASASALNVQESLTVSGTGGASVNSLTVNNQLNVTGASGSSAKQLNVTNAINVSGASAGTLNAGTGAISVSGASAASLNAGTGTIAVSGASAKSLNAGTGIITVSGASANSLNAGTGTISVSGASAASLNAGTGTIAVSGASANSLDAGAGSITVSGASASALNVQESLTVSGTGGASVNSLTVNNQLNVTGASGASAKQLNVTNAINVLGASAGILNAGTGAISVSGASAASLNAGTGTIAVSGASAKSLNAGTGIITVSGASANSLNAGTGTISVSGASAASLNAGTGTIAVSGASANSLDAGAGSIIVSGASASALNVQESLTVSGTGGASVNSLTVNNQLNVTGASGASAKQLNVTNAINVLGASAGILNAGTGAISVSGASAASLNAGTGTIAVSGASAKSLDAGTGIITVSGASANSLNAGTGTIAVSGASANSLDAGTGTITVSGASAGTLNAGTGTISVSGASAASLDAGTGTITVSEASASTLTIQDSLTVGPSASATASISLGSNAEIQASAGGTFTFVQNGNPITFADLSKGGQTPNLPNGSWTNSQVTIGNPSNKSSLTVSGDGTFQSGLNVGPYNSVNFNPISNSNSTFGTAGPSVCPVRGGFPSYKIETNSQEFLINRNFIYEWTCPGVPFSSGELGGIIKRTTKQVFAVKVDSKSQNGTQGIYLGYGAFEFGEISYPATNVYVEGNLKLNNGTFSINGQEVFSSNGTPAKGVKSFIIAHPDNSDKYLVHATLEGPENAVFYRGTACLINGEAYIQLPDYFEALTHESGRSVQLTPIDGFDRLCISKQDGQQIRNGTFKVISENSDSHQEFNWEVKAVRKDVPALDVEPLHDTLDVMSFGPYAYATHKEDLSEVE